MATDGARIEMVETEKQDKYRDAADQVVSTTNVNLEELPSPSADSGVGLSSAGATPDVEVVVGGISNPAADDGGTHNGPDEVVPTDNLTTWTRDEPVKLRMGKGHLSDKPISIPTAFREVVEKAPTAIAMCVKRGDNWKKWTYREYRDDVLKAAKSFVKLGLEPYHGVGIMGFNSPEWFISDLAAIQAGGLAVGIYTTNTPDACAYVASDCDANIIVVENDVQLQKILKVRSKLPCLRAIVQYNGSLKEPYPNVYTWSEFMKVGEDVEDSTMQARLRMQAVNKCCSLIYTSGTTGNPKGVMISHDNYTWTAKVSILQSKILFGQEIVVSYLPLSHVAAQLLDLFTPMVSAGTVYFAQPDALKGSLGATLKEVRPTIFLGVPRVWEKIKEKMQAIGKNTTGFKKRIAVWAKDVGYRGSMAKMNGGSLPFGWSIANALVFKKIRAGLGLDRCKYCITGAAPMMKETIDYFSSLDIPIMDIYGMSESSGPHCASVPWSYRTGSVGKDIVGVETMLADKDEEGNGEICMSGRHVFMGYAGMEEKTNEAIDDEGWLHSGDIGKLDKDNFLFITGRIKELIVTAGGENIPPILIEDTVKEELPIVSNCMLIGDKRKFLSMLITLKTEIDLDSQLPLDNLNKVALDWCTEQGSKSKSISDILDSKDEAVLAGIQSGIDRANKKAISNAQRIQKWSILPRDFSTPGEELGPTLKLKRPVVMKMYTNTIESFYSD